MDGIPVSIQLTGSVVGAGTVVRFKAPGDGYGGGFTVTEATLLYNSGTVATCALVDLGTAGTAVAGTIASFTVSSAGPNASAAGTPAGYWVDGGNYVGLQYGAGTIVNGAAAFTLAPGR
jgi:hypothetical protein